MWAIRPRRNRKALDRRHELQYNMRSWRRPGAEARLERSLSPGAADRRVVVGQGRSMIPGGSSVLALATTHSAIPSRVVSAPGVFASGLPPDGRLPRGGDPSRQRHAASQAPARRHVRTAASHTVATQCVGEQSQEDALPRLGLAFTPRMEADWSLNNKDHHLRH
jgi:hypothetical protein